MTLTEEKRFVVLLSLHDCGGQATKQRVLDNIDSRGYYRLTARDLETKDNRDELIWRNELAFIRGWLVRDNFLDDPRRNCWALTDLGCKYLIELAGDVVNEPNPIKLTPAAVKRGRELLHAVDGLGCQRVSPIGRE